MFKLTGIALAAAMLAGCGGQAFSKPINICLQPSDRTEVMRNCDSTIQPLASTGNVVDFVGKQMLHAGNVMGWIGQGEWRNQNFRAVINEFTKYPGKVTHVYVADEINLCNGRPCLGRDDALVVEATAIANAAGFKTTATITQSVIFALGFQLPKVDVIGVDPYYVTLDPNLNMGGCNLSGNVIANQYLCSVQKLRSLGYTGPMVYVGQGFGLTSDTHEFRMMYLQLQAEAYAQSGAEAVMSWGCYLGAVELVAEPNLVPLCGTQYEYLVTP
jgi:PII-like signaling protein